MLRGRMKPLKQAGTLLTLALLAIAMLTLVAGAPQAAWAANVSGGDTVCDGQYALCSSAQCHAIDGDPTRVTCDCEGPLRGQNIANTTCASREASLMSTFSMWDFTATATKAAKSSMLCAGPNAGAWAFCLDAPCTVQNGKTTCTCQLKPASDYYTFTATCPGDASALKTACSQIWSAANKAEQDSGYAQLAAKVTNPAKISYCPAK